MFIECRSAFMMSQCTHRGLTSAPQLNRVPQKSKDTLVPSSSLDKPIRLMHFNKFHSDRVLLAPYCAVALHFGIIYAFPAAAGHNWEMYSILLQEDDSAGGCQKSPSVSIIYQSNINFVKMITFFSPKQWLR